MLKNPLTLVPGEPTIAYVSDGDGPPLVFLHGLGGNRDYWVHQMGAFPGWKSIAWDTRGYGDSGPVPADARFADYGSDLKRLLDHLASAGPVLVGHSMGGRIALDFAARHPDILAGLVLVDTSAITEKALDPRERQDRLQQRLGPILKGLTPADFAAEHLRRLVGPDCPAEVVDSAEAMMADISAATYRKTLEMIAGNTATVALDRIRVPAMVVVGENDPLVTPLQGRELAGLLPDAGFETIPRAGHLSNLEAPEAFNRILARFLATIGTGRPADG